ncbi:TerB family tellurite resistance protein [Nannocystis punicea]|uniref:TerB family tellurite resistance protein n=1 Tax=Nannocystis punicea TaxID=2995304 RepID=A0ABY7H5V5_9BACT|nr:TerB family tellurite resistance protein [Nannocystis poenicansa]WAS94359.1 TerB family tellurite resistance protein [Nannocystis poenicansa]
MGWFSSLKDKLNSVIVGTAAGEWAVTAMAVMVFADGEVEAAEIEKAKVIALTNPVVKNSIGSARGEQLFKDAVETIKMEPGSMIQTYLAKLDALARKIGSQEDKNFALAGVIAVASADGEVERPEYDLLVRFKAILGATLDLPAAK